VEATLSDHDAKRLLKGYGVRVSRQAPTNTPTGAVKVAKQIGVPVQLVSPLEARVAETIAEVKRIAALLLQTIGGDNPSVMVREHFAEVPRAQVRIVAEKGIGLTMQVGDARALMPLSRSEGQQLAQNTAARRAADQRAVVELLQKIALCAVEEDALFDLDLFVGAEPAVVTASGELRRRLS
jgi:acyl-CoA synthetase (NDP forming)